MASRFLALRKFQEMPTGDKGDTFQPFKGDGRGDKATRATNYPPTPATVAPVARVAPPAALEKRELHFADIMALPIRPCTTCGQLHWHTLEYENDEGRIRQYRALLCDHYGKRIVSPTRGCRCIHFERKWSIH